VWFTWDPDKAATNKRKHGVTFAEAASTFADVLALLISDPGHPDRSILIGLSSASRLLLTVHVQVSEDSIRIISARRATPHERRRYEEGDP
jgi:uncharacterized DUF497 family protein